MGLGFCKPSFLGNHRKCSITKFFFKNHFPGSNSTANQNIAPFNLGEISRKMIALTSVSLGLEIPKSCLPRFFPQDFRPQKAYHPFAFLKDTCWGVENHLPHQLKESWPVAEKLIKFGRLSPEVKGSSECPISTVSLLKSCSSFLSKCSFPKFPLPGEKPFCSKLRECLQFM